MKINKILFAGILGFSLSIVAVAGTEKNMIYAQQKEVVYKAFAEKLTFSDKYFNYQWGMDNDGSLKYSEQVGGKLIKQPVTNV